jgi:enamine deaminase RidA (YjgF/YER057c/UK114 family)
MGRVEDKLTAMGLALPEPWPLRKLERAVRAGNLVFTSGAGSKIKGRLGAGLDVAAGVEAARECGLQLLANLKAEIGDLDRVRRIVKLLAMVTSAPDFGEQPAVANGCTDLLIALYGEAAGRHARSAVGMAALPGGCAVEIEMIVELSA